MKKKSLIESLKSTRKANVVTAPAKNEGGSTRKVISTRLKRAKMMSGGTGP